MYTQAIEETTQVVQKVIIEGCGVYTFICVHAWGGINIQAHSQL